MKVKGSAKPSFRTAGEMTTKTRGSNASSAKTDELVGMQKVIHGDVNTAGRTERIDSTAPEHIKWISTS